MEHRLTAPKIQPMAYARGTAFCSTVPQPCAFYFGSPPSTALSTVRGSAMPPFLSTPLAFREYCNAVRMWLEVA